MSQANYVNPDHADSLRKLALYTVGFVRDIDIDGVGHLLPAGSGTIIDMEGVVMILTAAHVIDELMKSERAGVFGVETPGVKARPVVFETRYCDYVTFGGETSGADGPDIGVIKLPPNATAHIAQNRLVYNMVKRIGDPPKELPDLALAGFPSTALVKTVYMDENERRDLHTLQIVGGHRGEKIMDEDGFDRFDFVPEFVEGEPLETYQGMSGGALWLLDANDPDTIPLITGVVYHQSDRRAENERTLYVGGTNSIYTNTLAAAHDKWVRK
jgi:hypothetical protein